MTPGEEMLLDSSNKEFSLCNQHEWEFKQQYWKSNMDITDRLEERVQTSKCQSEISAKNILKHIPLNNVINMFQWFSHDNLCTFKWKS